MTALSDIAKSNIVEVGRRFRGVYCLHPQGDGCLMMEMLNISETSVSFYPEYTAQ